MMKIFLSCFFILLFTGFGKAQLSENFNDGDFSSNPAWSGGTSDFIVNSSLQLQSDNISANSNYFLTTPNTLATAAEWQMYVQIGFNPSSANYIDVYLTASANDLTLNTTAGYFVRIGNTDDEISLYRKDASGVSTKIIDGRNGVLNSSNNVMKIKVVRDVNSQWILSSDLTGTGNSYASEGSVIDATYTTSAFFGFSIKQSTASFFQKHFIDDIEIKDYIPDVTPPSIQSVLAVSSNAVDVLFDEPVEAASSQLLSNYSANNNVGNPVTAFKDVTNASLVHLTFSANFANAVMYALEINNVQDLAGNTIKNGTANFSFYTPQQSDVVIDEIMADPTPQVGLPNSEWVELRNTSSFPINLAGWKLADAGGLSGAMPAFILQPDSFVIICTGSSVAGLLSFGNTISVTSFPSLDNDGELLSLLSSTGQTIHAVQYSSVWYQNELKKDGGWTLEMIDTKNPCSGISNWKASVDANGGTPGQKNSVDGVNNDEASPKLLRAFAINGNTITLVYDEPLDSIKAAAIGNYSVDNGIAAVSVSAIAPLFNKVNITLSSPLTVGIIYTIAVTNIADCKGNAIGSKNSTKFGIAQEADSLDIVINEILYNPRPDGVDYVEIYNRSKKIIDLSHMYIANRNSGSIISSIQQLSAESILLLPEDFMLISSNGTIVKTQYVTSNPDAFIDVTMPSFSDDTGDVILLNNQGNIVDEVKYSDNWQFPLITNTEGVSLERIDYEKPSVQNNFHSAATSVGYGTPGYKNSQYRLAEEAQGTIAVSPNIFSPDNDGIDDFATIDYSFPSPGYVANVTIFDATGRTVRYLQRNSLTGIKGYFRWDGLDDKNRKLPQGIYIIYTEIFNTEGKKKQFKNIIVLARRY